MQIYKHILLVEDNEHDIKLILNTLEEFNLANETVVIRDGVEALDYLYCRGDFSDRAEGNPVLIMLDIKMPRMDGIQVIRQLKNDENKKQIPIVVLTSSSEEKDMEECYRLGINGYVVKPIRFEEFVDAVKQIGIFWVLINEPPPERQKE